MLLLDKEDKRMKKLIEEFKEFAIGGNLLDMAVGVIIGGAFNAIIGSLVADVFTPLLGMLFGNEIDFSELKLGPIAIGNFINTVVSFTLTALCLFAVIKSFNKAKEAMSKKKEEEEVVAEPSEEIKLLTSIEKELKKLNKK